MGMYTELVISTKIKDDPVAVSTIKRMLGMEHDHLPLPDHPLFSTDTRWNFMLQCSSHYFVPRPMHLFEYDKICKEWCFITRSDFKNYDNDVELFLDWIAPYLACEEGKMIGYSRYEEAQKPTIHYGPKSTP